MSDIVEARTTPQVAWGEPSETERAVYPKRIDAVRLRSAGEEMSGQECPQPRGCFAGVFFPKLLLRKKTTGSNAGRIAAVH